MKRKNQFLFFIFISISIIVGHIPVNAQEHKRIALVIGNSKYTHSSQLDNPIRDARLIATTLQEADFEVRLHLDADFKTMKRAIRDFSRDIRVWGKQTIGLVYFAGHGTQVSGKNYLIPIDANITSEADVDIETVDAQGLLSAMHHAGNELNIIILDACRNNPYKRGSRASVQGFARMDAPTGALIAYSTQPGNIALDGESHTNSPYAKALAETIRKPGIMIEQVFKTVRNSVRNQTSGQQIPWEESSLFGDFYFSKPAKKELSTSVKSATGSPVRNSRLQAEIAFWNTIKDSEIAAAYASYLKTFPKGVFADLAKLKMNSLETKEKSLAKKEEKKVLASRHPDQTLVKQHKKAPAAKKENCMRDYQDGVSTRYCVSSVLPPTRTLRYGVLSLLDDSNVTAWTENIKGHGIGEWISAEFENVRLVTGFTIKNGYNKRRSLYFKNSRVKAARIIFSNGSSQIVRIQDKPGKQEILFNRPIQAKWMQFKILSAYKGTRYKDNCVNEFRILSQPVS